MWIHSKNLNFWTTLRSPWVHSSATAETLAIVWIYWVVHSLDFSISKEEIIISTKQDWGNDMKSKLGCRIFSGWLSTAFPSIVKYFSILWGVFYGLCWLKFLSCFLFFFSFVKQCVWPTLLCVNQPRSFRKGKCLEKGKRCPYSCLFCLLNPQLWRQRPWVTEQPTQVVLSWAALGVSDCLGSAHM